MSAIPTNSFSNLFSNPTNEIDVKNGKLKLKLSADSKDSTDLDSVVNGLQQMNFKQKGDSESGRVAFSIDIKEIGLTQEEIDKIGKENKAALVRLVADKLKHSKINYEDLPTLSFEETNKVVQRFQNGQFLLQKSSQDPGHLIVAIKVGSKVEQKKFSPGKTENTFAIGRMLGLWPSRQVTLDEVISMHGGRSMMRERTPEIKIDQVMQKVFEKYEGVSGELISKTDKAKTGMSVSQVQETVVQALDARHPVKYKDLPVFSDEASGHQNEFQFGQFSFGQHPDEAGSLIIRHKGWFSVEDTVLPPGKRANTFIYTDELTGESEEISLQEVIKRYAGVDEPEEQSAKFSFWKDETGKPVYAVKKLGAGTFGKVYRYINTKTGDIGVLKDAKRNNPEATEERTRRDLDTEYTLLQKIHEGKKVWGIQQKLFKCEPLGITTRHGTSKVRYGTIGPQYSGDYSEELTKKDVTIEERLYQFHQLLFGLKTLHEKGILHGDIKPENIFVRGDKVFIADLGGACLQDKTVTNLLELIGGAGNRPATPFYTCMSDYEASRNKAQANDREGVIAIEKLRDVFSMGCVFYLALSGNDTRYSINSPHKLPVANVRASLMGLVFRMYDTDYKTRPNAEEVFNEFTRILETYYPEVAIKIHEDMKQEGFA